MQSVVTGFIILGFIHSWKFNLNSIKVVLYLQAIQFIFSNFNVYDQQDSLNFEGLNMLSTMFSVMFCIFNCFLANMVVQSRCIRFGMNSLIFCFLMTTLLFTNFTFDGMNEKTTFTIVIAAVFMCILLPSFELVSQFIISESQNEAKLFFTQRDEFRRMFDGL